MTGPAIPEELRDRDPEFIRAVLPPLWLAATVWFRAEVHGFENVPDEPVLFVCNHSGGGSTPDTFVFLLAYNTYFTVEGRPLYALAHDTITAAPVLGGLTRKLGVVPAENSFAEHIFPSGGSALVYPGGDVEALRPWRDRYKIMFSGRKGFLRLAHKSNVKIVPVVATGGHDTLFDSQRRPTHRAAVAVGQIGPGEDHAAVDQYPVGSDSRPAAASSASGEDPHAGARADRSADRFGDEPDWDHASTTSPASCRWGCRKLASRTVVPIIR